MPRNVASAVEIIEAFCAGRGPVRFYLGETLKEIGPSAIKPLVDKAATFFPKDRSNRGRPEILLDAAKVLKNFGTAAKESTPFLEKAATAMPSGEHTWRPYVEEAIEAACPGVVRRPGRWTGRHQRERRPPRRVSIYRIGKGEESETVYFRLQIDTRQGRAALGGRGRVSR